MNRWTDRQTERQSETERQRDRQKDKVKPIYYPFQFFYEVDVIISHTDFKPGNDIYLDTNQSFGHLCTGWLTHDGLTCILQLTHFPPDKMAAVSQTIFSDAFSSCSWMNSFIFWMKLHQSLFLRVGPTDNNPALVLIMAWRRICDKPLSEPMLTWFAYAYVALDDYSWGLSICHHWLR